MYFKININQYTIADFLLKLSYETWDSVFEGNDINIIFNSFLNIFLWHYYSSFLVIKANKLSNDNSWITSGIRTSRKRKWVLYIKLRNNKNPTLRKYFKDYCLILSKVIKEAKRMEYDRHILNSNNVMRTSWTLIKKELSKDHKNHGLQSVNINGRSTSNHQIIASAFNKHFTTIPDTINQNINANCCLIKTSVNNQNKLSFSLKHVFQISFPKIKYHCTTTKEIENIITSFKSSNSCGYNEVLTKLLK